MAAVGREPLDLQACHGGQGLCAINDHTRCDSDSER